MAEARQAVAFQFAVTDEGIKVQFDRGAVKAAISALAGSARSRYQRARNAVFRGIFPASPLSLAVVGGAVCASAAVGKDPTLGLNQLIGDFFR